MGGSNSGVESQPSKLLVAGSNPVSRSNRTETTSPRSSGVEHVLGKDGVTSSNLVEGSTIYAEYKSNGAPGKRNHHVAVHRVQASELLDEQEQEDHDGEAGTEEVLPSRAQAHAASRNQVRAGNLAAKRCICTLLRHLQANSSIGRAAVSKTAGWGFEPLLACHTSRN
jgi:hypothetical protein